MIQKRIVCVWAIALAGLPAIGCRVVDGGTDNDDSTLDSGSDDFDGGPDASEDDGGPGFLCPDGSPDPFVNQYSPYYGGEVSVDLEVVAFAYFRCPHCADFSDLAHALWQDRPDIRERVRFYFHHFPFSGETPLMIHAAAHAAHEQGMEHFWAMHDFIYAGINAEPSVYYTPEELVSYAETVLDLDMDRFNAVMQSPETEEHLLWDKKQAQDLGITGTPAVFICGEKIPIWKNLESSIDKYLVD